MLKTKYRYYLDALDIQRGADIKGVEESVCCKVIMKCKKDMQKHHNSENYTFTIRKEEIKPDPFEDGVASVAASVLDGLEVA